MTEDQKDFIDNASYETLLQQWRFAKSGSKIFQGDTGEYYSKVMFKKRDALPPGEAAKASKRVGW